MEEELIKKEGGAWLGLGDRDGEEKDQVPNHPLFFPPPPKISCPRVASGVFHVIGTVISNPKPVS